MQRLRELLSRSPKNTTVYSPLKEDSKSINYGSTQPLVKKDDEKLLKKYKKDNKVSGDIDDDIISAIDRLKSILNYGGVFKLYVQGYKVDAEGGLQLIINDRSGQLKEYFSSHIKNKSEIEPEVQSKNGKSSLHFTIADILVLAKQGRNEKANSEAIKHLKAIVKQMPNILKKRVESYETDANGNMNLIVKGEGAAIRLAKQIHAHFGIMPAITIFADDYCFLRFKKGVFESVNQRSVELATPAPTASSASSATSAGLFATRPEQPAAAAAAPAPASAPTLGRSDSE